LLEALLEHADDEEAYCGYHRPPENARMQPQGNWPAAPMPPQPPKKTSPVVWILGGCGVIALLGLIAVFGAVWWGYHKAKSYAEQGGDMTSVRLWSDVPPLEGMTPSQQAEMPLPLRIVARSLLDTMLKDRTNANEALHWDVAFYVAGGKTTRDVEAFYVPARMGQYGWQQKGGCTSANQATFCTFLKQQQGGKGSALIVMAADDPEHKTASLYYIRQDVQGNGSAPGKP
jgi:hypothetical protein